MANLARVIEEINRKILKIDGPSGKRLTIKTGQGEIKPGQVMALEYSSGLMVKYNKAATAGTGVEIAHTVFMEEDSLDATSEAVMGLFCRPGTTFNMGEIQGIDPSADHKAVSQLFKSGICLEEVR